MVLLTALLVPMFALALQSEKRAELANEKSILFSQEMASSSSHSNNDIPLATLLEWYKIRDTFFGGNFVIQNIPLSVALAASCQHPDARWLTQACAGKDVNRKEDAKRVFSALGQNDARALCFSWLCGDRDLALLRRAGELGFAWAQAWMAALTQGDEKFKPALLAAAQGERDGFAVLGYCLRDGEGCEEDLDKAKETFLVGSELGDVWAIHGLGDLLGESDPQRWRWWGRAAALGKSWIFLDHFAEQVDLFNSGSGSAAVMVAIGQALQGHVNEEASTIFRDAYNFGSRNTPAKQAIAFYEAQIKATKDAMRAWTQVGIKLKVVKDVRKLIAKLIWDSREEALYDVSGGEEKQEEQEEQEEREQQQSSRALRAQKRARK
jgi:TPR repeat protein